MEIINKIKNKFYGCTHDERRAIIMSGIFFLVCTALGVLIHFGFDLLGGLKWIAPFVPVNESVWEHLKLTFISYVLILTPIEYFLYGKSTRMFIMGRLIGALVGISFVVMEFYTIKGAFGEPLPFVNIIIYCIATLLSYLVPLYIFLKAKRDCSQMAKVLSIVALAGIFIFFLIFTYYPPKLPLFLDPTGAGYGYYMFK